MLGHHKKQRVSVSLRSIIHSYSFFYLSFVNLIKWSSFRLLTEYHSFLYALDIPANMDICACFRLLTEYHSFLSYGQKSLLLQYVFRMLSCNIFIFEIFLFILVKSIFNSSFFTYRLTNIFL